MIFKLQYFILNVSSLLTQICLGPEGFQQIVKIGGFLCLKRWFLGYFW